MQVHTLTLTVESQEAVTSMPSFQHRHETKEKLICRLSIHYINTDLRNNREFTLYSKTRKCETNNNCKTYLRHHDHERYLSLCHIQRNKYIYKKRTKRIENKTTIIIVKYTCKNTNIDKNLTYCYPKIQRQLFWSPA